MRTARWERLAPLTGALAIVVIVVAIVGLGGSTPDIKDSPAKVLAYYQSHHDRQMNASFLVMIGAAILLFFVGTLRHELRRHSPTGRLANVAFAGGIIAVGGVLLASTIHIALADGAKYGDASAVHALNLLDNDNFIPMSAGIAVMTLAASASALRTRALPKWLAIVGVVAGVVAFSPLGFIAFLVCLVWIIATSIALYVRGSEQTATVPSQQGERAVPQVAPAK